MCPNSKSKMILSRFSLFHSIFPFKRRKLFLLRGWMIKPEIAHPGGVHGRNLVRLERVAPQSWMV